VAPPDRRDAPGRAPAVAVEHRQRPQVHRARLCSEWMTSPQRVEVGAAVGVDDALGLPGRARGVVDRDRGQLVGHRPWQWLVRAAVEEVGRRSVPSRRCLGPSATVTISRTVVSPSATGSSAGRRSASTTSSFAPGVVADISDLVRREAGVDRDQHGAGEGHGEVRHEQLGAVSGTGRRRDRPGCTPDACSARAVRWLPGESRDSSGGARRPRWRSCRGRPRRTARGTSVASVAVTETDVSASVPGPGGIEVEGSVALSAMVVSPVSPASLAILTGPRFASTVTKLTELV
jgi:hypothetical protein